MFVVEIVMTTALIVARILGCGPMTDIILKSLASLSFVMMGAVGYSLTRRQPDNENKKVAVRSALLILIGFVASFFGDFFLDIDASVTFILGVVCFALAHIFYSIAFTIIAKFKHIDILNILGIFAVVMCILRFGGTFDFKGMFPVLICYGAIISVMVAKAYTVRRNSYIRTNASTIIAAGATLFIISDVILLYCIFGVNTPENLTVLNLIVYYLGQGFLALSLGKGLFSSES